MNDFLRNLRSPHKKETPLQQKTVDSRFYNQPDRRMVRDRRTAPASGTAPASNMSLKQIGDALPQFIDTTSIMAEQLERIASVSERIAESENSQKQRHHRFF